MKDCAVIIVASGKGVRVGGKIKKQFLYLQDEPILVHTIKKFYDLDFVKEIILVLPKTSIEEFKPELEKFNLKNIKITSGGKERQNSVMKGLKEVSDSEIILIHDGVRPFVSRELITLIYENTKKYGATIPFTKVKNTIKEIKDGFVTQTLDRENLVDAQTPQGFKKDIILKAYKNRDKTKNFTDDSSLVEDSGISVFATDGDDENIKITTKEDLIIGELILKKYKTEDSEIDKSDSVKKENSEVDINNYIENKNLENKNVNLENKNVKDKKVSEIEKAVIIYTDGACSGNPGAGGYGSVIIYRGVRKEISDGFKKTTNNRMELLAVIEALNLLKRSCDVQLYSDSKYVTDAINKGWIINWKKKNWRRGEKNPVANIDLWEKLDVLLSKHNVTFNWVKGHAGNVNNERCDELAREAVLNGDLKTDEGFNG